MKFNKKLIPILLILVVATGLRFYKFSDQAFTYDEFSTLFRLDHDNFHDLICLGVLEDGHPAGFHVYSYFYTKVFGSSEQVVKFPIIVLGIFSVFMVYVIGKKWFNSTAGLYAASFMAFLQYAVAQSQIARMYGFGIPFILLMVYFWDKIINNKFNFQNSVFFTIAASICTYTHYFCLLFVAIVWISGIFLIKKSELKKYLTCGIIIFLLFTPFLKVFFHQLSKGGIEGWLGPFYFDYFFKYMSYVFHHSWVIALIVVLPIIIFFNKNVKLKNNRYLSLVWFLLPMIIGFTYSYFVSNVIHERVLYFSFPFLLLFLGSFMKEISLKKEITLVLVLLIVGSSSLFLERKHQKLFNDNRYKLVAESFIEWGSNINHEDLLSVKATHQKIDSFYNTKHKFTDFNSIYVNGDTEINDFIGLLSGSNKDFLYFARAEIINSTLLQIALQYYPEIIYKSYTYAGDAYLLKKKNIEFKWPCIYFEAVKIFDTTDFITENEFIGTFDFLVDSIIFSENNLIQLSTSIYPFDSIGGAQIVSSMEKNGKIIDWRSSNIDDFIIDSNQYNNAMFTVSIPDIRLKKGTVVKFFIWNPNKSKYKIENFKITTIPGNPFIYGGTEIIPVNLEPYCL